MAGALRDELFAVCSKERPDPLFRYLYRRRRGPGGRSATVILFNPVHSGNITDPTTGRCMTWLCSDGEFNEVTFVNLFARRDPTPAGLQQLARSGADVVGPRNDHYLREAIDSADRVVVAWGAMPPRIHATRAARVLGWIADPYCFGYNADHSPLHPNRRGLSTSVRAMPYQPLETVPLDHP